MTGPSDTLGTPARRSGFRLWSGAALLLVVLAVTLTASLTFSSLALRPADARSEIEAQLTALTGLPVLVAGSAEFTLLPRTQITLGNIRVGASTGSADAVMEIDAIVARLDLWDALWGHARIEQLTLVRPELLSTAGFVGGTDPGANVPGGDRQDPVLLPLSRYAGAFLSRFGGLRRLDIRDGVFRMSSNAGSLGISNANLTVAWPSKASSARMTGSYVWNGQPTEINLSVAAPLDFLAGQRSGVDFTLASPPLTASFDGEAAIGGAGSFSGNLSVATPSLTHSIRWLGDPKAILPDIGPLSVDATVESNGRKLNLRDAKVSIDGFQSRGGLEMLLPDAGRPALAGTLAFDRLDLTGFATAIAPLPQTVLDLQRRIPMDFIDDLDLDLRLSAAEGAIGTLPVRDLAATVKFKDGIATLDLGDAAMLGGQAQARLTVDSTVRPPAASGVASLAGVDTAGLLAAIGVDGLTVSGTADVNATFDTPVTNWADLSRRNRIHLDIAARNGDIGGFDPQILTSAARPLLTAMDTLPFLTLRARLKSQGPLIDIDRIDLSNGAGTVTASGSLSATTHQLDLSGSLEPVPAGAAAAAADPVQPSSFRMQGIWPKPAVTTAPAIRPI